MSYQTEYSQPPQPQPIGMAQPPAYSQPGQTSYMHNNVVVSQPTGFVATPHVQPPDYLILSIVAIFFCWPLAICAIMYSVNSRSAASVGDITKATSDGRTARTLGLVAIGCGIGLIILIVVLQVTVLSTTYCYGYGC